MRDILISIALVILSLSSLITVMGTFGAKLLLHWKDKKIEVTNNHIDNLNKQ